MKKTVLSSACAVALGLGASAAFAQTSVNANVELDYTHWPKISAPAINQRPANTEMGGRLELNIGARKEIDGGNYLEGKATGLLKTDGTTAVDDMWLGFGNKTVQFKAGRFEAYDLFPMGLDTMVDIADWNADPAIFANYGGYAGNKLRGRFGSAGNRSAHIAMNTTFGGFGFELGLVAGSNDATKSVVKNGVRPVVYFNAPGGFKVALGYENFKTADIPAVAAVAGSPYNLAVAAQAAVPGKSVSGYAATIGYNLMGGGVNFNYAKSSDLEASSMGLNGQWGGLGLGWVQNKATGADQHKNDTFYAAYQLPLMGIKGASITPALSYSKGKNATGANLDDQIGARVRFRYDF